jgi:signal transduction histidine kinase
VILPASYRLPLPGCGQFGEAGRGGIRGEVPTSTPAGVFGYVNGAALLAPAIALYFVTSQVTVRHALAWAFVTLAALLTATAANNPCAYAASVTERAEQEARRRLDEERLRIARELHDVVAHTMATINVQAGTALHVLSARPEAAPDALAAIKKASKDGLSNEEIATRLFLSPLT